MDARVAFGFEVAKGSWPSGGRHALQLQRPLPPFRALRPDHAEVHPTAGSSLVQRCTLATAAAAAAAAASRTPSLSSKQPSRPQQGAWHGHYLAVPRRHRRRRCGGIRQHADGTDGGEPEASEDSEENGKKVPSYAGLLAFAAPLAAVSVSGPILSTIDTAFVGQYAGTLELAALGPACTVADLIYLICSGIGTGAIRAYADVQKDLEKQKQLGCAAITLAVLIGSAAALLSAIFSNSLLRGLSAPPSTMAYAAKYISIRAIGLPMATMAAGMYGLCVGQNDTRTPFIVTVVVSAILNVFGDWLFCARWGLGTAGAAWATVSAQAMSFIAYVFIMRRKGQLPLPSIEKFKPSRKWMTAILEVSIPVAVVVTSVLSMYAGMSKYVNSTQPVTMAAAYKVIIGVFAFVALCADPLAAATTTKLPPLLKTGSTAKANLFVRRAATCALGVGLSGAIFGASVLRFGASIFTTDPAVIASCAVGLTHFIAVLGIMHPSRVFQNTLLSHGDFKFYMAGQLSASMLFFVGLWFLSARAERLVALGTISTTASYTSMWSATLLFYIASGIMFFLRARHLNGRLERAQQST